MSGPGKQIQLATIGAAHDLKGEVRVKSFTADPLALGRYGALFDALGRRFEVASLRRQGEALLARFAGVDDRKAAEALNGVALLVDRSALPDEGGEDEFYHADLIGLAAADFQGSALGTVKAVHDFGGGDIIELALAAGGSAMVPFTRAAVPAVDVAAGRLTVDPLAAGLIGDDDEAPE